MGDARVDREHLLVAFFQPLSPQLLEVIHSKFPEAEVSTLSLPRGETIPSGKAPVDLEYHDVDPRSF